jgi:uncharacterized RDD family membrane protein YckC
LPDYAGFWPRALAFLIDALVVVVVLAPLVVVLGPGGWDLLGLLAAAVAVLGFWRYCGATPGKIAVGLKIVDAASGGPPTLGRLVLRFFAYFVSALPLYLGFVWAAFDRRKQGWHDKIARTVVINSED